MDNTMGLYSQMNTANNGMWSNADANQMLGAYNASQMPQTGTDGLFGMSTGGWSATGDMLSGLGSIGNIVLGFQSLGLMEDQLGLQQEQWGETKAELNYMRATRDKLNASYA